ncbi:MAG TPA: lysylphosphatidylglycerol synthase domain-containing protein [Bacteroidales bacterium]|nr:lysylphosphatidylglycerol synthase domain-containing protein [Bacteroidales bacterium]
MPKAKLIKTANYIIKILIIFLSFGFIGYRLFCKEDLAGLSNGLLMIVSEPYAIAILAMVLLLMLCNWSVESLKWQYLVRKIEQVSFRKSFMAVWAGLTIGSFTPYRTGEYFGRAFILSKANRWEGVFITFTGSLGQLLATLLFGGIAGFLFVFSLQNGPAADNLSVGYIVAGVATMLALAVFVLYFRISFLKTLFQKLIPARFQRFRAHFDVYSYYSFLELLTAFVFSVFRYVIFSIQFYILMRLCNIDIPLTDGLMVVSCIFLAMSAIPTFALSEIGVRGSVSILLLELYFENLSQHPEGLASAAVLASFLIWFINLIIPALIGVIFVFRLKFFRN